MTYKDLEDSLNKLILDFTSQEKQFLDEVLELNAYDTVLRQNQQKVPFISDCLFSQQNVLWDFVLE